MIPFPDKQYSVIYADPPWAYNQGGRGAAKNQVLSEISWWPFRNTSMSKRFGCGSN